MKYKTLGNAVELFHSNRELFDNCYVFRDATKHFGGNELVGALYRIVDKKPQILYRAIEPKWVDTNTLYSGLIAIDGWESDFFLISKEEAIKIIIEWGLDPSKLI